MRPLLLLVLLCPAALPAADEFTGRIRPVLVENCSACHSPSNPKNRVDFLKANTAKDIESRRGLWRNVAAQLRNRTMPPTASKLTEEDRLHVASWIDERLRQTACSAGDFAGAVTVRRLNRREYHSTIRDLLGVDLAVSQIFPVDGSGGEGFDTNAETLFVPPLLMERYLEAAQQVLDRAIITPPLNRTFAAPDMNPPSADRNPRRILNPGEEIGATLPIYADGEYSLRVWIDRPRVHPYRMELAVNGNSKTLEFPRDPNGGATNRGYSVRLSRGVHSISLKNGDSPVPTYSVQVDQQVKEPSSERKVVHYRLFGLEAGEAPSNPRRAAASLLASFARKAYRRPLQPGELDKLLAMYDRSAERGDPYEESVKLALKAVLVSPAFLFRLEKSHDEPGIYPISAHELATRLSYFLWSTTPDDELSRLADEGRLTDPNVLHAQVQRMIEHPRSRAFANAFIGQWLGTKDLGGRVAPTTNDVQHFYTPLVAADMREEPVLLFHDILTSNRSALELLSADYTFLTERLVKFYELESQLKHVQGNNFQRVQWPDQRRAGVLGLGAVLAMTSHFKQTSPVLRGAWVLETLLGTTVPPPPEDVPPLETAENKEAGLTMREKLLRHREDPACATCHNLMDPIGFGLENFDWLGRWRDTDNGKPVDASGTLPSGEKFTGPVELRQVLLERKDEFVRHLTGKLLGYALGRGLEDGDQCTIQRIVDTVAKDGYRAADLVREIVLSVPFRNVQGGLAPAEHVPPPKRRPRPKIDK